MKKMLFISCVVFIAFGCTNNDSKDTKAGGDTTKMGDTKMPDAKIPDMPYQLARPYPNWQAGDPQHALTAMKGLKAYENGDIAACMPSFGDSVRIGFDYYHATLSNDSLKAFFTQGRSMLSSVKVKMDDWESVIAADKSEEWVTLWYKEYTTDKKGVVDSLGVVNDIKIEKGKIVVLDEKTQHLGPAPVKK